MTQIECLKLTIKQVFSFGIDIIFNFTLAIMFNPFINQLKARLELPLPGQEAQFEMAHLKRERIMEHSAQFENYKPSAVLILLYPIENQAHLLLIKRMDYKGHHSGQIALPGGKFEEDDVTLEKTALREFCEETGCIEKPTIIGKLTPVYIPVSQFVVQPYVSYLNAKPSFAMNTQEVQQLIEWRIDELMEPEFVKETTVQVTENLRVKTNYFDVQNHVLWGATAMMLNELKHIISKQDR